MKQFHDDIHLSCFVIPYKLVEQHGKFALDMRRNKLPVVLWSCKLFFFFRLLFRDDVTYFS